jgi:3-hydroxypropanoate dehydrogenase
MPRNAANVMTAPIIAVIAYDLLFYKNLSQLFSVRARHDPELQAQSAARQREGSPLLVSAPPSVSIAGCPASQRQRSRVLRRPPRVRRLRSGFLPRGHARSNFPYNLGHGDPAKLFVRGPRLAFQEACALLKPRSFFLETGRERCSSVTPTAGPSAFVIVRIHADERSSSA